MEVRAAEKLAYGGMKGAVTDAEHALYQKHIVPLLSKIEDIERERYMDYLMGKDD